MKKLLAVIFAVMILLIYADKPRPANYSYRKFNFPSEGKIFNIEGIEGDILVCGGYAITENAFKFDGNMKLNIDKSIAFTLKDLIVEMSKQMISNLSAKDELSIILKENISIKSDKNIYSAKKMGDYFEVKMPISIISEGKKIIFLVDSKKEIEIKAISFGLDELTKMEEKSFSWDFEKPDIDIEKGKKHIKIIAHFDEEKNLTKIAVVDTNFEEEEKENFLKALRAGEIKNKEELGESMTFIFAYGHGDRKDAHEIVTMQTSGETPGPDLTGLDLETMKVEDLVNLLIDNPISVTNNNKIADELLKRGKEPIPVLIKAIDDEKFNGRGYCAWVLAKVIDENGDIEDSGIKKLSDLIADKDDYVKMLTVSGLSLPKDERVIARLVKYYTPQIGNFKTTLYHITGEMLHSKKEAQKWWRKNRNNYKKQF